MGQYSLEELEAKPTLADSGFDDLKVSGEHTRVWLSRCTIEDGEPYNNKVTIEMFNYAKGRWEILEIYEAL